MYKLQIKTELIQFLGQRTEEFMSVAHKPVEGLYLISPDLMKSKTGMNG